MPKDPTRSQAKFTRGKGSGTKVRKVTLKGKPKWKAAGVRSHLRQSDLDAAATDFARKFPSKRAGIIWRRLLAGYLRDILEMESGISAMNVVTTKGAESTCDWTAPRHELNGRGTGFPLCYGRGRHERGRHASSG